MASGVRVSDECKIKFSELKMEKAHRYVVYRLSDDMKEICVCKSGGKEQTYDDLVEDFKTAQSNSQCRWAVYDADFMVKDQKRKKIILISWSPDDCPIKQKMVYSASKDALKKALGEGIGKEMQANDHGDLAWSNVLEKLQS